MKAALSGAVSGLVATAAFALVHQFLISDIWRSFSMMAVPGAVCGAALGFTYFLLSIRPGRSNWFAFCGSFIVALMVLGVVSLVVFEPRISISLLMLLSGPPADLIREALPITIGLAVPSAVAVAFIFGHRWWHVFPALLTTAIVFALLGLNVSILGMVEFTGSGFRMVAELAGMLVALVCVYAAAFAQLWRAPQGALL